MFRSRVEFSGSVDRMALFPVRHLGKLQRHRAVFRRVRQHGFLVLYIFILWSHDPVDYTEYPQLFSAR